MSKKATIDAASDANGLNDAIFRGALEVAKLYDDNTITQVEAVRDHYKIWCRILLTRVFPPQFED